MGRTIQGEVGEGDVPYFAFYSPAAFIRKNPAVVKISFPDLKRITD
jgi:hypothetical protein